MGKLVVISLFVAALSAFLGERIINLRKRTLASRKLVQTHLPNCHPIKSLEYGSEDLTILPNGLAIISTGLKDPVLPSYSDDPGKMYTLDMSEDSRMKPVELRMGRGFDLDSFNPHGISVYTDETDNSVYLFVVNHPQQKTQVEIFLFVEEDHSLVYVKTIKHEFLHSVNDIVAVGVESFYATNDHYFSGGTLNTLEVLLAQPWSNVVYYSPEEVKVVAEGFYMANGINISPDKRHIYVADLFDHNIHVLERLESNGLAPVKVVEVGSLVDNIYVDPETGDLWIGCHPNGWKLFRNDPEDLPGSEVIQIKDIHSEKPVVTQVYADDGSVLIGSSVAAPYGGKLLIGTIYQKALVCDLAKVDQ
ncbi:serum paraoxonase/arylesterase 2-like [Oncorhynchus kisutch]|uniref:Paraoxonase n=1 Tax=Oncorhynchus kisutch TaxID=8019 RepID=A0A8C7KHU7_ONCKI|nr:serum paraoxonase/arylesterase 2-like [Oncorhynchus kisutch]XP_031667934.1 serum paraoxonase/arylesterase 2-like [Oncorhynchus kisutch]XP_052370050.1 serum paraoxonase/arylesterase 2-like [Oncorhynchus keta]XP_052370059.1 serum paraoxonase/arylesterase 2-like [Oncorhynchus keta]